MPGTVLSNSCILAHLLLKTDSVRLFHCEDSSLLSHLTKVTQSIIKLGFKSRSLQLESLHCYSAYYTCYNILNYHF